MKNNFLKTEDDTVKLQINFDKDEHFYGGAVNDDAYNQSAWSGVTSYVEEYNQSAAE